MKKHAFHIAFALGALAVLWVAAAVASTHLLVLVMTSVIAAVYVFGALELRHYRTATAQLAQALTEVPGDLQQLGDWLARVPASLQNAVRQRIEGERSAFPGLALTPYLVGLLVMLGMLGTFLGMVVTFKGAVFALEGSTDLQAIRAALAAPIKGLGLSFGTSVAGVAASATLGLLSALSRRERVQAGRLLDRLIASDLRPFSLAHQRQESVKALQAQASALPDVMQGLKALMDGMEQRNQRLGEQLLAGQAQFHQEVSVAYTRLADTVGRSLTDSLGASARIAGDTLRPVVETAMRDIALESTRRHEQVIEATQAQLHAFTHGFDQRATALLATIQEGAVRAGADQAAADQQRLAAWTRTLESMAATLQREWQEAGARVQSAQQAVCEALQSTAATVSEETRQHSSQTLGQLQALLDQSESLVRERVASEARWMQSHGERLDQLAGLLRTELGALRDDEAARAHAAVDRLGELQSALATQLATLGTALEAPMTRLIQTASEVPQAAAGVITQLRTELGEITERDTRALQERAEVMAQIHTLLQGIRQSAGEQRAAVEALAASATTVLEQASRRFADTLETQAARSDAAAAQLAGSAVELATLGDSFHHGVMLFSGTNEKLVSSLMRIEDTLGRSIARSDEQLAYYVEQAREVIELSVSSQQVVMEELRRLTGRARAQTEDVAA